MVSVFFMIKTFKMIELLKFQAAKAFMKIKHSELSALQGQTRNQFWCPGFLLSGGKNSWLDQAQEHRQVPRVLLEQEYEVAPVRLHAKWELRLSSA